MTHWGATKDEWAAWRALSEADLAPVVSRPDAEISPQSKLVQKGKVPSVYNGQRLVAGFPGWTQQQTTAREAGHWSQQPDYGICLITRRYRAIDIDCEDAALVARIEAHILAEAEDMAMLGDVSRLGAGFPTRVRADSPRRLLLAEVEGNLAKTIIRLAGEKEQIEVLANGQQCIVAGTHVKGARYEWLGGVPTAERTPIFTAEAWDALIRSLAAAFGTQTTVVRSSLKVVNRGAIAPVDAARDPVAHHLITQHPEMIVGREPGKIHVRCPWADEHSDPDLDGSGTSWLVAGETKDADGNDEPPRFRCLHAHCAERGEGLFKLAIGALEFEDLTPLTREPEVEEMSPTEAALACKVRMLKVSTKEVGANDVASCIANAAIMMGTPEGTRVLDREFAFDNLTRSFVVRHWQRPEADGSWSPLPVTAWRPITDSDKSYVRWVWDTMTKPAGTTVGGPAGPGVTPSLWSSHHITKPLPEEHVRHALHLLADPERKLGDLPRRTFDSAQCVLYDLKWDGVPRIEEFWVRYAGVADTPYARAVGLYTWTGLAGRVLEPAIQADMTVLLLGTQGARKTSFFKNMCLAEHWYATINLERKEEDLLRELRGKVIVELEELRGLADRQQEWTKAFLTRTTDEWVPKYEEFATSYARRNLFFGSGNHLHILDDATGERRYLPLHSGPTDPDGLLKEVRWTDPDTGEVRWSPLRELLWAEGVARFKESGVAWEQAEILARPEHAKYKKINDHPWREIFGQWIFAQLRDPWHAEHVLERGLTTHEFLTTVVSGRRQRENAGDHHTVTKLMQIMNWQQTWREGRFPGEPKQELWLPPVGIFGRRKPSANDSGYPNGHPEVDSVRGRADPRDTDPSVSATFTQGETNLPLVAYPQVR